MKQLTGAHVATIFACGFGTIIAVNGALAYNAVQSFPGIEVKNSYIASQSFDDNRRAQQALAWEVSATLQDGLLRLVILEDGVPIAPMIDKSTFGLATSVAQDQTPDFYFDGSAYIAPVNATAGNWNLRLVAHAADGTVFQQRVIVENAS